MNPRYWPVTSEFDRNLKFFLGIDCLVAVPVCKTVTRLPPFIGILLAVATLEHTHILSALAGWFGQTIGRLDVIVIIIGLISAVVDNVSLVAASIGMLQAPE